LSFTLPWKSFNNNSNDKDNKNKTTRNRSSNAMWWQQQEQLQDGTVSNGDGRCFCLLGSCEQQKQHLTFCLFFSFRVSLFLSALARALKRAFVC